MDERQEQMIAQCKAVAHMASALAEVYRMKAEAYALREQEPDFVELIGKWSASHMETIGNILNGMDAIDEDEDDWIAPVFEKAHEFWPDAA